MASYRKRGDRWQVRVHGIPAHTFRTKKDAQAWARDQETAKERGGYVDRNGGKATVGEWWEAFQETSEWRNLRPTSKQGYSSVATRHVLPHLGQARLMDLRRGVIQAWVDGLDRSNTPQTACEAHKVLRRLLQAAVKRDLIGVNPALGITRPKASSRPHRILTMAEVEAVAEAAGRDGLLVRFMAYTGLRFGEVAGLTAKHVNLLQGTLRVQQQIVSVKGGRIVSEPKTEAARREVALPGFLVAPLRDHMEGKGPEDFVFTSTKGGCMHPSNTLHRVWHPALKAAGIQGRVRIHDLRHTAISLALASGATAKEAQSLAGHASFQTTMNVYGHLLPGAGKALASRMDALRTEALQAFATGQDVDKETTEVVPLRPEKAV